MSLGLRLELRQSQGLVMTPQLQQAIKLLQLGNLELCAFVAQELEQNPFLEQGEPVAEALPEAAPAEGGDDGWQEPQGDHRGDGFSLAEPGTPAKGGSFDDEPFDPLSRVSRPQSLRELLAAQLHVELADPRQRLIGSHLIDLVDEAGYLREPLAEVASRLGCELAAVEAVLGRLQQFEPTGVCARDLAECLALQLAEQGALDPPMRRLLDHLDLLGQGAFERLAQLCGVTGERLATMIARLRRLNPKPGLACGDEPVQAIVPDIFVLPTGAGEWRTELNAATLPRVLVNADYYVRVSKGGAEKREREYLSERFQSANWLVKALDQRARTVLRVSEAVFERQVAFLYHGIHRLRPLVLRDVAEATGLHESTISRATADKHVATPRGTYPLKYFFSNALPGADGEPTHAAEAIRQKIKALIEHEPADAVLSDDQIVETLRGGGVVIARRTVAKYRESLGIASSVQRRRAKALKLA